MRIKSAERRSPKVIPCAAFRRVAVDVDQGGSLRRGDVRAFITEVPMVERSHTAGWLPQGYAQAYAPLNRPSEKVADWFAPKADAGVGEDAYEITLELPGVAADDLQVLVQDGTLTVQGEKRFDRAETGLAYFFSEREFGAFQRSFRLPPDAVGDRIDAVFKNGVLSVRVPKLQAGPNDGRRVAVRTD
jgi:HSP20 family protein